MLNLTKFKFVFLSLVIFFISFSLYHSSLNYFFFSDDFFELNLSKAENIKQYSEFFKFREDIIAYRPVSLQNYFFLSSQIFGFNPVGFRIITFVLFFSSALLLIALVKKITGNIWIGFLTAFFWLTSSIHFMAITWIAAAYNITGTFFWLLTSFLFLKFLKTTRIIFYVLSLFTFLITIGSFEFSVTWPAIFGFYYFYVLRNSFLKSLKVFSPFFALTIIYLLLRMILIKVPQIVEYQIAFNIESIKALFWYLLWTLNIPEEFKKQVVNNLIVFNSKFLLDFWPLVAKTFIGAIWIVALGIGLPVFYILKQRSHLNIRLLTFSIFWIVAGISPVLILPNHTFTMYLTLASIGIYFLIAYLVFMSRKTFVVIPILLIWIFASYTTLSFYKINSWMIEAQKTARAASVNLKRSFATLPSNSVVLYPLNSHWERQALSGDAAIWVVYNDPTLSIYYNKRALLADFRKGLNKPVYIYIPND